MVLNDQRFNDKEIIKRLSEYKEGNLIVKGEISEFLMKFEEEINFFKGSAEEIQKIIEDMLLSSNEFEKIQVILAEMEKETLKIEKLFNENKDILQDLRGLGRICTSFITFFQFMTDVTSHGGYFYGSKKDNLYYLDVKNLNNILDTFDKIYEKPEKLKKNKPMNKFIEILEEYINHIHYIIEDFVPNIAYITLPDSIKFLNSKGEEIKKHLKIFSSISQRTFLQPAIKDAFLGLESLREDFNKVPIDNPIKLKKFLIKKKGTAKIDNLIKGIHSFY